MKKATFFYLRNNCLIDNQHGEVDILLEGNIIIATLVGGFNEKGAVKYTEGVKAIVKNLEGKQYAILVDNSDMEGGTPEAYHILEEYNQWLNKTNLIAKAIVVKTIITTELIKSLSPSIKRQTTKSFQDKELAFEWLKELIS